MAPEVGPAIKAVILNVSNREGLLGVLANPPEKLPPNALWKHVAAGHANDLVVLASADDLRAAGVRISRSLSWERTALDVADGLATHPVLRELGKARHLIVRFGVSGALHATRDGSGQHQLVLYYDPMHLEGEFRDVARQGEMIGYNSVFAATLATAVRARLAAGTPPALPAGQTLLDNALADEGGGGAVRAGVANCRAYFLNGFGPVARDNHRRLEEWDQLGNPDARRTYPSQLTAQAIYRQEHVGGPEHLATFELTQAERLPFLDPFFPRWFANAPSSKRRHGGELIDPVELLKELEARMELVFEAHRAEVKAAGGPKVKLWKTTWDLPTTSDWMIICAVTAPRAGRKALADAMATSCARVKPGTRPRAAARDYVDGVKDLVGIDLDWDYGWPVRVRAFAADAARVARAVLPVGRDPEWEILPFDRAVLRDIAREIVCRGAKAAFARPSTAAGGGDGRFPVAEFGDLRTADRAEGESYRSVRNLIRDYLGKRDPDRPLSLAVFGPPGGGKSFGVKQIAKSLGKDRVVEDENNLSQFTSPADLSRALIRTRDKGVGSKVPLVFFDEFDAALGGEQLAWLKYFLSVMQDGTHRFEGGDLRVGPAILVFAGGTSTTFAGFAREAGGDAADRERFVRAKGPDFVSRLRGHVNIVGPNPSQVAGSVDADPGCLIRRALILDHQLRRHHKKLVDSKKKLRIDDRALQLLLAVPCYTHGSRSVEAVVETSTPVGSDRFDTSALLAAEQLAMHVNWGAGTWDEFVARQDRKPWWP